MKINLKSRALVFVFVALSGLGFFLRSSFFNIQKINVKATSPETALFVEKQLERLRGTNMWELEPSEVSAELIEKSKSIQSAQFQRRWPSDLVVLVEERRAVAQTFFEGAVWLIDVEGVAFNKKISDLPLYWPLPADKRVLKETLTWIESDNPRGVNGLTWDKELGLVAYYEKNIKIVLGRESFSNNWRKATESLEYLKTQKLHGRKIDATYNNRAVVSL